MSAPKPPPKKSSSRPAAAGSKPPAKRASAPHPHEGAQRRSAPPAGAREGRPMERGDERGAQRPAHRSGPPAAHRPGPSKGPAHGAHGAHSGHSAYRAAPSGPPEPWNDEDLEHLQELLDDIPGEPLDVSMLDGFLVGVLLQPKPVALSAWWPWVLDSEEGRAPERVEGQALLEMVQRRFHELRQAIAERQWFDPWVFELDEDASPSDTVLPWVAGFALAADVFPGLMSLDESEITEPLAQLYMHLDPEDLEDADALLEEIESLEPPEELEDAVECLVRASLLLADVSQPRAEPRGPRPGGPRRGPPVQRRR